MHAKDIKGATVGPNVLEEFSNRRYSDDQTLSHGDMRRVATALDMIGTGKRVLDIGCRDGIVSSLIKERGKNVYGIDISLNAVELTKKKGIEAYHVKEEESFPFENDFFEAVFAGEVIEHVLDTDKFIEEIRRVLSPGGVLVITTPNVATFGRRILLLFGRNPLLETTLRERDAGHIRYFTRGCLKKLLEEHGFEVTRFTSETVNFDGGGRFRSALLARIFPTLGRSLIMKAKKNS
ncbi:MAG: hypothetical protein BMS9Abin23_0440 [Thermodesulfobacteriota bacterium]|nr:MAG: hypothetical protein BMS9Abin23_0440 [Thermodesulfobacteriota bacterium]